MKKEVNILEIIGIKPSFTASLQRLFHLRKVLGKIDIPEIIIEEIKDAFCKEIVENHPDIVRKILKYTSDKYKNCPYCGSDKVAILEIGKNSYKQDFKFYDNKRKEVKNIGTYDFCFKACLICGKIIKGKIYSKDCSDLIAEQKKCLLCGKPIKRKSDLCHSCEHYKSIGKKFYEYLKKIGKLNKCLKNELSEKEKIEIKKYMDMLVLNRYRFDKYKECLEIYLKLEDLKAEDLEGKTPKLKKKCIICGKSIKTGNICGTCAYYKSIGRRVYEELKEAGKLEKVLKNQLDEKEKLEIKEFLDKKFKKGHYFENYKKGLEVFLKFKLKVKQIFEKCNK